MLFLVQLNGVKRQDTQKDWIILILSSQLESKCLSILYLAWQTFFFFVDHKFWLTKSWGTQETRIKFLLYGELHGNSGEW